MTGPLPAMLWHERTQAPFVGDRETFGFPTQTGRSRLYRARPILSDAAMTPLHAKTDLSPPMLCQGCHPFDFPSQPPWIAKGPENRDIQTVYILPDIRLHCNITTYICQPNRQISRLFRGFSLLLTALFPRFPRSKCFTTAFIFPGEPLYLTCMLSLLCVRELGMSQRIELWTIYFSVEKYCGKQCVWGPTSQIACWGRIPNPLESQNVFCELRHFCKMTSMEL